MKKISKVIYLSILSLSLANATPYSLDDSHTQVGFSVKHLMITNVTGEFKTYNADIDFDAKTKKFNGFKADIETKSIDTGIEKRDEHLRSEDFFLSEKFPKMTFVMKSYKSDGNKGKMSGDLTIKDVTKAVTLDVDDIATVKDFQGNNRVGFTLKGKINRMDYGLKWNKTLEAGGLAVSEEVKILVEIEAIEE